MTAEEIRLALRMVAMGRPNHPATEQLVEALEGLIAGNAPAEPPPVALPADEPPKKRGRPRKNP